MTETTDRSLVILDAQGHAIERRYVSHLYGVEPSDIWAQYPDAARLEEWRDDAAASGRVNPVDVWVNPAFADEAASEMESRTGHDWEAEPWGPAAKEGTR